MFWISGITRAFIEYFPKLYASPKTGQRQTCHPINFVAKLPLARRSRFPFSTLFGKSGVATREERS
jgi:hypothetical protein